MKLIGFVLLQLSFGKRLHSLGKNDSSGDFFRFALNRISKIDVNVTVRDKCAIQLVEETVNRFGNTYLFVADNHPHEELLHNLRHKFVHSYFTDPSFLASESRNYETFYNLLIFRKKFKLREVIKRGNPSQSTKFFIFVKNYQDAIEKFEILWQHRLVNAVASFVENADVYYYTYFPYRPNQCSQVGTPYLLAKCNIFTGVFSHREKLFPQKVNNLHKCPINVTFVESLPSFYFSKSNELVGWEVHLLSELLERINGIPNFKVLRSRKNIYSKRDGYQRLVENSEMGGGSTMSLKSLLKTDFCLYGMSVCMVWVVPKQNTEYSADFLTKVFSKSVWMLLLLTYFVTAFVISLLFKSNLNNVFFKLLPFLLGTTTRVKKTSRIFAALWLWFCLIVNAHYQSGYQSRLLVPQTFQKSMSTTEIMNSNLKISGASDVLTELLPYFKRRYNIDERRFKYRKSFSYDNWVYRMTIRKDFAFFEPKEVLQYYIGKTELANKIYIPEACVMKYLLALVLKKNSHLTSKIVQLANRFNENGFLEYFIRKHLSRERRRSIPKKLPGILKPNEGYKSNVLPPPINMQKISAVFMCVAAGATISLVVFSMELVFKWGLNKIKEK